MNFYDFSAKKNAKLLNPKERNVFFFFLSVNIDHAKNEIVD